MRRWRRLAGAGALGVLLAAVAGFTLGTRHYENFFPLQEKTTWEYAVSRTRPGGAAEKGKLTVTNLARTRVENQSTVPRQYEISFGGAAPKKYTVFFHNDGDGLLFYAVQTEKDAAPQMARPPFYYLKNPLNPGTVWGGEGSPRGRVEGVRETVRVPAGTFRDCVRVKLSFPPGKPLSEGEIWYAERVGIVKSIFRYHDGLTEEFLLTAMRE